MLSGILTKLISTCWICCRSADDHVALRDGQLNTASMELILQQALGLSQVPSLDIDNTGRMAGKLQKVFTIRSNRFNSLCAIVRSSLSAVPLANFPRLNNRNLIAVSGLRISCATPAASAPTASFSWRSPGTGIVELRP
jgi:hypothetical protein